MAVLVRSSQNLEFWGSPCVLDESFVEATNDEVKEAVIRDIETRSLDKIPETVSLVCDDGEEVEIKVKDYLLPEDLEECEKYIESKIEEEGV